MQRGKGSAPEAHASHVVCEDSPAAPQRSPDDSAAQEQLALEAQYIELYLMKYICTAPECYGTFVPEEVGHSGDCSEGRMACNVCGHQRTDKEFMRDVEKLWSGSAR